MKEIESHKKRREYISPRCKTYVIEAKAMLATSAGGSTEKLDEEDFDWSNGVKGENSYNLFDQEL